MNEVEAIAKALVECAIPGSAMRFRDTGGTQTHDFDLELPDRRVFPLEATQAADEQWRALEAALRDPEKGGKFVPADKCRKGWIVMPTEKASLNRIRKRVDEYLALIERSGIEQFLEAPGEGGDETVHRIQKDLGIRAGWVYPWPGPNRILISVPLRGGFFWDASPAEEAALQAASGSDNRRKLAAVDAEQRHLFVYIDHSSFVAWGAINNGRAPDQSIALPEEITHLWVAARTCSSGKYVLWRAESGGRWHVATHSGIVAGGSTNE